MTEGYNKEAKDRLRDCIREVKDMTDGINISGNAIIALAAQLFNVRTIIESQKLDLDNLHRALNPTEIKEEQEDEEVKK